MAVTSPPTPPASAATSPTIASTQSTGFSSMEKDLEKQECNEIYNEKNNHFKESQLVNGNNTVSFPRRVGKYLKQASISNPLPHILCWRRKSDGRQMLVQRIEDHPKGYPQLAAFANSDDNFLMCRRFGFLHNRVLLYRQDELSELEKDLIRIDKCDEEENPVVLTSRSRDDEDDDPQFSRKVLINKIDAKLKDYDNLIMRIKTSISLSAVTDRNYHSFSRWILDKKPLSRTETEFLRHREDFVALADGQEGGWFDGFLENTLGYLPRPITKKIFLGPEQREKTDDDHIHLYSKYRIDILVRLILTFISVVLLMAPTAALFLLPEYRGLKIFLIMVFTLLFSAALSVFTKAKRHEMFAGSAAYCAVLVVFLGNTS